MNTSKNNKDIRSENPFERLIFENGIRALDLRIYRQQDLIVVVLNNGTVLQLKLSAFPDLRKLSKKELSDWNLVNGGIGFEWSSINYDISLKSILEENAIFTMLKSTIRRTYKKAEIA